MSPVSDQHCFLFKTPQQSPTVVDLLLKEACNKDILRVYDNTTLVATYCDIDPALTSGSVIIESGILSVTFETNGGDGGSWEGFKLEYQLAGTGGLFWIN